FRVVSGINFGQDIRVATRGSLGLPSFDAAVLGLDATTFGRLGQNLSCSHGHVAPPLSGMKLRFFQTRNVGQVNDLAFERMGAVTKELNLARLGSAYADKRMTDATLER